MLDKNNKCKHFNNEVKLITFITLNINNTDKTILKYSRVSNFCLPKPIISYIFLNIYFFNVHYGNQILSLSMVKSLAFSKTSVR